MLNFLVRSSIAFAMTQRQALYRRLALAGNRERCSHNSFLDPIRPNAIHTDFFLSGTFRRLNTNVLQIREVVTLGDARRFSTVTAEIFGFSALAEFVTSARTFSANVANP